jgi:predicted transposase/invertase (TIGR01784 family)
LRANATLLREAKKMGKKPTLMEVLEEIGIAAEFEARGEAKGKARGEIIGEERGKQNVARNMLAEGEAPEKIARLTGLSVEKVAELGASRSLINA